MKQVFNEYDVIVAAKDLAGKPIIFPQAGIFKQIIIKTKDGKFLEY